MRINRKAFKVFMVDILGSVNGWIVFVHFSGQVWSERAHWLRAELPLARFSQHNNNRPRRAPNENWEKVYFRGKSEFTKFRALIGLGARSNESRKRERKGDAFPNGPQNIDHIMITESEFIV